MLKQTKAHYPANFTYQNQYFTPPVLSRFHFQSNQGNPSSMKPYYYTQSGLTNSNGIVIITLNWKEQNCYDKFILNLYRIWFWDFLAPKKITAPKMKFSIKDFFGKCDQIRRKLWIWSYLLEKSLKENFIFRAVNLS